MTWFAPEINRRLPPTNVGEREMLQAWLDFHRDTLLLKCANLTAEQLASASIQPSNLTLLGLVRHMAGVEREWFRQTAAGLDVDDLYATEDEPDADLESIDPARAEADFATFGDECRLGDDAVASLNLSHKFQHRGKSMNLRWVYNHMIEEYARHNGHADLIRERIDGTTGV